MKFYQVYKTSFIRSENGGFIGTQFDETDYGSMSFEDCIKEAVNRCGTEARHQFTHEKQKTMVTSAIWEATDKMPGMIVFSLQTIGRNEKIIIRYAVSLTPVH